MTVAEMQARILKRLDELGTPVYYTGGIAAEILNVINEAQRMFALLTLCLETSGSIPLSAGVRFYLPLSHLADWLVPLRVSVTGGAKLTPVRLADLDARDSGWLASSGAPERYSTLGWNLMILDRAPTSGSLTATYARCPAVLGALDTPVIPVEYHPSLVDYAIPRLRAKEGGQEFQKTLNHFDRFLKDAAKLASYVRARNLAHRYDRLPPEERMFDRSKWIKFLQRPLTPAALVDRSQEVQRA